MTASKIEGASPRFYLDMATSEEIRALSIKLGFVVSNVEFFDCTTGTGRETNDKLNSAREHILEKLLQLPAAYLNAGPVETNLTAEEIELYQSRGEPPTHTNTPAWGEKWKALQKAWRNALEALVTDSTFNSIKVIRMAGRNNNYDFKVLYMMDGSQVAEKHIEFKHNVCNIYELPQFLSLSGNCELLQGYAEYFYDNHLRTYMACDPALNDVVVPQRDVYVRLVHQTNYDAIPFFRKLYDCEDNEFKGVKAVTVNRSIKDFLERNVEGFNMAAATKRFHETQLGKDFLLWDGTTFIHKSFTPEDMTLERFVGIKNGNTVVYASQTLEFRFLLRWRNHKGVLMPAWQISAKLYRSDLEQIR